MVQFPYFTHSNNSSFKKRLTTVRLVHPNKQEFLFVVEYLKGDDVVEIDINRKDFLCSKYFDYLRTTFVKNKFFLTTCMFLTTCRILTVCGFYI